MEEHNVKHAKPKSLRERREASLTGDGMHSASSKRTEVVMMEAAMEAELSTACCVTVAGSMTPDSSRFS